MFNTKQTSLIDNSSSKNSFIESAMKETHVTTTGNGAKKYSTSGNDFVNQFTSLSNYKSPRTFDEIASDCELLYSQDKLNATKFTFFIRTINRVCQYPDGSKTLEPQKGGELRHEAFMRLIWLSQRDKTAFYKNIKLLPIVGSWKDIFQILSLDLQYNGWDNRVLDWNYFGNFILSALENDNTSELIKKYLPQIKSTSKCKTLESQADTIIAKWICSLLFGGKVDKSSTYKQYRLLKSSGTAHTWQQLISKKQFDRIDFNSIHGRALSKLVKSKFLSNHNLVDKYNEWISSPDASSVKYTGFVHELFEGFNLHSTSEIRQTIDKQFNTLVEKAGDKKLTKLIVVRDTSGSMSSTAIGTNSSSYDVAKAMALFFSDFLTGEFSNSWIEFNSQAVLHKWKGTTATEKWLNDGSGYVGSTNFQSVIDLFCRLKSQGINENEFPTGILCISDCEFDPSSLNKTNVETAKEKLKLAGFSSKYVENFIIILWNIPNGYYGSKPTVKFETFGDVQNVYYMSGYSGSLISFLTDEIKTAYELFLNAINQEILNLIELS